MMHRLLYVGIISGLLLLIAPAQADEYEFYEETEMEPRIFFTNITSGLVTVNGTLLAYALIGLTVLGLIALAFYYLYVQQQTRRQDYYNTNYNQYYKHSRSSDDPSYDFANILQWIAMVEEVYRKFDPNDMNCQKRVICEMTENKDHFGPSARTFVKAFSYLDYFDVLDEFVNLPDFLREMVDEYKDALDVGRRRSDKLCGEYYGTCKFSLTDTVDKYIRNNSIE